MRVKGDSYAAQHGESQMGKNNKSRHVGCCPEGLGGERVIAVTILVAAMYAQKSLLAPSSGNAWVRKKKTLGHLEWFLSPGDIDTQTDSP